MRFFKEAIVSVWRLLFPSICLICEEKEPLKEDIFCLHCKMEVPYTDHFSIENNELKKKFVGRIKINRAIALLYFSKSGSIQGTLHQLKYRNKKYIGVNYGNEFGRKIQTKISKEYWPDVIIPVPLHKRKRAIRGYNQSSVFAQAINSKTNIPINEDILLKTTNTDSQTSKSRTERFENVLNSFEVKNPDQLINKHVMIVDDVCTTGATLEACCTKLQTIKGIVLSVGVIALAQ